MAPKRATRQNNLDPNPIMTQEQINQLVAEQVAAAIANYEATRVTTDVSGTGGSRTNGGIRKYSQYS
jgi:hypothetical protein